MSPHVSVAIMAHPRRAAFVPMYESQLPDEWIFILRDCGAKMVIAATAAEGTEMRKFHLTLFLTPQTAHAEGSAADDRDSA